MFRLDKLTQKAQEALQATQGVAEQAGSQVMFPLHLLIALAEELHAEATTMAVLPYRSGLSNEDALR